MPITLILARVLAVLVIVLLAATAVHADELAAMTALAFVWLALLGVLVFVAEATGLLSRALRFFFGRRP